MAPHPLATLRFDGCRVPVANRLGEAGQGFKVAMMTLDIFAPRWLRRRWASAVPRWTRRWRAASRPMFGGVLGDLQLTQAALGEMATAVDAAALLTYRAAGCATWHSAAPRARRPWPRWWRPRTPSR